MSYTTLRVVRSGVVLFDQHLRRLAPDGGIIRERFLAFARHAYPGIYSLRTIGTELFIEWRDASRLVDGMPVRYVVSPFAGAVGPFDKPAPPSAYDGVRAPGFATLLTSSDGRDVYESDLAAVLSWRGERLVLVPSDAPRVASTAEQAIAEALSFTRSPVSAAGSEPLALVNAVKGVCLVEASARAPFPPSAVRDIEALLQDSTRRG